MKTYPIYKYMQVTEPDGSKLWIVYDDRGIALNKSGRIYIAKCQHMDAAAVIVRSLNFTYAAHETAQSITNMLSQFGPKGIDAGWDHTCTNPTSMRRLKDEADEEECT